MRLLAIASFALLTCGALAADSYTTKVTVNVAGKTVQKPSFKQAAGEKATMQVQLTKVVTVTLGVQAGKDKTKVWVAFKGKEQAFLVPVGKEFSIYFLEDKQMLVDSAGRTLQEIRVPKSVINELGGLMLKVSSAKG